MVLFKLQGVNLIIYWGKKDIKKSILDTIKDNMLPIEMYLQFYKLIKVLISLIYICLKALAWSLSYMMLMI